MSNSQQDRLDGHEAHCRCFDPDSQDMERCLTTDSGYYTNGPIDPLSEQALPRFAQDAYASSHEEQYNTSNFDEQSFGLDYESGRFAHSQYPADGWPAVLDNSSLGLFADQQPDNSESLADQVPSLYGHGFSALITGAVDESEFSSSSERASLRSTADRSWESQTTISSDAPSVPEQRVYKCAICDDVFTRRSGLDRHRERIHHIGGVNYQCDYRNCARSGSWGFGRKDHLRSHYREFHMELDIPKRGQPLRAADIEASRRTEEFGRFWRCAVCLHRNPLATTNWVCRCGKACEQERRLARRAVARRR